MRPIYFLFLLCTTTPSAAQSKKAKDIEKVANYWADANNRHDVGALERLYAPRVLFYGKPKDVSTCISDKATFFKTNNYSIIISDIDIDFYKNGTIKCNFNKQESWKGVTRKDQAYLLLEKRGNKYLITGESDKRMDDKMGIDLQLGDKEYRKSGLFNIIIGALIVLALLITFYFVQKSRKRNRKIPMLYSQPVIGEPVQALPTFSPEILKKNDGLAFEEYIVKLFDKNYFTLLHWRGDKFIDGHYPLSNMDPDLDFRYKDTARLESFAIECKWRKDFFNNTIEIAKDRQLSNYRNYQAAKNYPVFIVLGIGGTGMHPKDVFIIPLSEIKSTILKREQLSKYYRYKKGNFFLEIPAMNLL